MSAAAESWFESRAARRWGPWIAAFLGAVVYANTLRGEFVYDDAQIVRYNPRVRNIGDFRAIWLSDWWQPQTEDKQIEDRHRDRLYRPLTLFSFAVNYAIHDLRPGLFLATNLLLHATVCGLVFVFVRRLLRDELVAWLTALLFAVHPLHCEAVANVVGRAEILSTLLILLGLLTLLPRSGVAGWGRIIAAMLLFMGALLAKETAISYLPAAAIVLWMKTPREPRRALLLRAGAMFVLPLLVYFPLRYNALGGHLIRDTAGSSLTNPLSGSPTLYRFIGPFQVLGHYTRLLLFPAKLSSDYGAQVVPDELTFDALPMAMTAVGLLSAAGLAWLLAGLRRPSTARQDAGYVALLFLASYVLISNTILLIGIGVAERVFYWPSVSALMLVAMGLAFAWRRISAPTSAYRDLRSMSAVAFCGFLAVLGARAWLRNYDWRSNAVLFESDVLTFPQSAYLNQHHAMSLLALAIELPDGTERQSALAEAEKFALESARLYPRNAGLFFLRGRIHAAMHDDQEAIRLIQAGLSMGNFDLDAKRGLATLLTRPEELQGKLSALRAAAAAAPDDVPAHLALGEALLDIGQHRQALPEFEAAVRLAPENAAAQRMLGEALLGLNEEDQARAHLRRAVELDPDDWRAHTNLGVLEENEATALAHAERAYRLRPDLVQVCINYAERLMISGRRDEAMRLMRQTIRNLPPDSPLLPSLNDRLREMERRA